jgi:hypothetical protein
MYGDYIEAMLRFIAIVIAIAFVAVAVLAFLAGRYMS